MHQSTETLSFVRSPNKCTESEEILPEMREEVWCRFRRTLSSMIILYKTEDMHIVRHQLEDAGAQGSLSF